MLNLEKVISSFVPSCLGGNRFLILLFSNSVISGCLGYGLQLQDMQSVLCRKGLILRVVFSGGRSVFSPNWSLKPGVYTLDLLSFFTETQDG